MALSQASRAMPVPATTKARGVAAIVLGGGLALTMASFMALGGFRGAVLAVFASVLLAGLAFAMAGFALFRHGAMSTLQKAFVLGALGLVVVTVGVLREQLGLAGP